MKLICLSDVCKYNANCRDCLYSGDIRINEDGECDCFEYYKDAPEYQNVFFKSYTDDNRIYKEMSRGRKVECNGFTLYYEDKELTPETLCTEEISGYSGQYRIFQNTYTAKFIREKNAQLEYKNVRELPYEDGGMAENMNS